MMDIKNGIILSFKAYGMAILWNKTIIQRKKNICHKDFQNVKM